jgi:Putative MetA-pathway of phenol degradation
VTAYLRAAALAIAVSAAPAWAQSSPASSEAQIGDVADRADDLGLSFSTGASYSSGDYGAAEKTKLLVVPFSARAKAGNWRLSATLPYLRIDSPGNIVGGGTIGPIIIDPDTPTAREVRKGLGDLSLGAAYSLPSENLGGFGLDLSGRVKLPTSSERKSLGTGKTDFAVAAEVSRAIGTWSPFVTLGYRFFGDPAGLDLRNGPSASVGTTAQMGSMVAIASYDYARATSRASEDAHELFGALSGPLSERLNWTAYGIAGLSEGSPDYGVGLLLTFKLR